MWLELVFITVLYCAHKSLVKQQVKSDRNDKTVSVSSVQTELAFHSIAMFTMATAYSILTAILQVNLPHRVVSKSYWYLFHLFQICLIFSGQVKTLHILIATIPQSLPHYSQQQFEVIKLCYSLLYLLACLGSVHETETCYSELQANMQLLSPVLWRVTVGRHQFGILAHCLVLNPL